MDTVSRFYQSYFEQEKLEKNNLKVPCPFCNNHGYKEAGVLTIFLKRKSFFYGFFTCSNRCVPAGYPLWFAKLARLPLDETPGYVAERELREKKNYPSVSIEEEIRTLAARLQGQEGVLQHFTECGISAATLRELQIGFNGRYIVYPYIQENGNCYAARCVHPQKRDDAFWHGDDTFSLPPYIIFNLPEINRCENGSLFFCEGEENAIILKQLGFPAIAVGHSSLFDKLPLETFAWLENIFLCVRNNPDSLERARAFAASLGFRARIVTWATDTPTDYDFWQLSKESRKQGKDAASIIRKMVQSARPFSPFLSPKHEFYLYNQHILSRQSEAYNNLASGFPLFDTALGGVHGINVLGGAPKSGKSTWLIQTATQLALRNVPVLYYDFENGRQNIYQRTVSRMARLKTVQLHGIGITEEEKERLTEANGQLEKLLTCLRVVNDRKINPALMRKHIEFIRHETHSDYTVVMIDSLHKLPFREFSDQRKGIDAWLREFEAIRDELDVAFFIISELTRGDAGNYQETPHMGLFKGSGDIEYSADNAMIFASNSAGEDMRNALWVVASREHSPGRVGTYVLDYPYWGFIEEE